MNLQPLCATPTLSVYYDMCNNWLFLEWEGELTLQSIKRDSLAIVRCFLGHNYARVLNSNAYLTSVDWDVANWLMRNMVDFLSLASVKQFAWVHAADLRGRDMAEDIMQQLPQELQIALFADIEQAVTWLQKTGVDYPSGCATLPRPAELEARLVELVRTLGEQLHEPEVAG
jgi:hypothetical protein